MFDWSWYTSRSFEFDDHFTSRLACFAHSQTAFLYSISIHSYVEFISWTFGNWNYHLNLQIKRLLPQPKLTFLWNIERITENWYDPVLQISQHNRSKDNGKRVRSQGGNSRSNAIQMDMMYQEFFLKIQHVSTTPLNIVPDTNGSRFLLVYGLILQLLYASPNRSYEYRSTLFLNLSQFKLDDQTTFLFQMNLISWRNYPIFPCSSQWTTDFVKILRVLVSELPDSHHCPPKCWLPPF